ncbi:hypothetical protein PFICI_01377 [Pestalotiopsis fici W106-1]|uniref:Uncharacterized protein n=1 Tax=Pestalotiopsis fici (strain W106-1 / CGMCC3.15140) TaxID=1229662 RepID=W3XNJ0_PESFW|nr:uncharacterized protein PFICI_01377 [Pestalotiopsis fici W106-1]ETS87549.1 hypothetical protein PFICI_01377 [Pestalotiopsis fici W106-1]
MIAFLATAVHCVGVGIFAHPGEDIELVNHKAAVHKATLMVAHAAISRCDDAPAALLLKQNAIFRRYGLTDALQYENSLGRFSRKQSLVETNDVFGCSTATPALVDPCGW